MCALNDPNASPKPSETNAAKVVKPLPPSSIVPKVHAPKRYVVRSGKFA
jgi:hypothetical protein